MGWDRHCTAGDDRKREIFVVVPLLCVASWAGGIYSRYLGKDLGEKAMDSPPSKDREGDAAAAAPTKTSNAGA